MPVNHNERILIITPAKDEAEYIEKTIASMVAQTHRPALWVIVDDGSDDNTGELTNAAAAKYDWIKVLHRQQGNSAPSRTGRYWSLLCGP